eukprot:m.67346 g.67346  ORF g.67346 m.67346 type:complete len:370 (-) comp7674_c0_seq1:2604-3713(-)
MAGSSDTVLCGRCFEAAAQLTCESCLRRGDFCRSGPAIDSFMLDQARELDDSMLSIRALESLLAGENLRPLVPAVEAADLFRRASERASAKKERLHKALADCSRKRAKIARILNVQAVSGNTATARCQLLRERIQSAKGHIESLEQCVTGDEARLAALRARNDTKEQILKSIQRPGPPMLLPLASVDSGVDAEAQAFSHEELQKLKCDRVTALVKLFAITPHSILQEAEPRDPSCVSTRELGFLALFNQFQDLVSRTLGVPRPFPLSYNEFADDADPGSGASIQKQKRSTQKALQVRMQQLQYNMFFLAQQDGMDLSAYLREPTTLLNFVLAFVENPALGSGKPSTPEAVSACMQVANEEGFVLISADD